MLKNFRNFILGMRSLSTTVLTRKRSSKAHVSEEFDRTTRFKRTRTRTGLETQELINELPKVNLFRLGEILHGTRSIRLITEILLFFGTQTFENLLQFRVQNLLTSLREYEPVEDGVEPTRALSLYGSELVSTRHIYLFTTKL